MPPTIFKWPIIRTAIRALICGVDCHATMYRSRVKADNYLIGQLSPNQVHSNFEKVNFADCPVPYEAD